LKYYLLIILIGTFFGGQLNAQTEEEYFPQDPELFISQINTEVSKFGVPAANTWLQQFTAQWKKGDFEPSEQLGMIHSLNLMYLSGYYKTYPDMVDFLRLCQAVKNPENQIKLPFTSFIQITDSCLYTLEPQGFHTYLNLLEKVLPQGTCFQTSNSSWRITATDAKLEWNDLQDPGGSLHPKLVLGKGDLVYQSERDSTVFHNTIGEYHLTARLFYGAGGTLNWAKVGLDPGTVYADLGPYALDLNFSKIEIDSVTLHYHSLFKQTLKGKFLDINQGVFDPAIAEFPEFISYEGGVKIDRFIPNVLYEGGFKLKGTQLYGIGTWNTHTYEPVIDTAKTIPSEEIKEAGVEDFPMAEVSIPETYQVYEKARINILDKNQKIKVKVESDEFKLNPDKLTSTVAKTVILLGKKDSLTHPGLNLIYDCNTYDLILYKDPGKLLSRQAIYNSYTKFNIYSESLKWNVQNDTVIAFTAILDKENKTAAFESEDYFSKMRFDQFRGILNFHPAGVIYAFALKNPGAPIFVDNLLTAIRQMKQREAFLLALLDLEASGFIRYDPITFEITPEEKLFKWVKSSRGKRDYDPLLFTAAIESGDYARLSLTDNIMDARGISYISFSDTQYVKAVMQDDELTLLKNRDILFNGIMAAGKINLTGVSRKNMFHFNYNSFRVDCDSLDSMRFILVRQPELEFKFSPLQLALRNTTFEGLTGAIYIDKPDNKSSRKKNPAYSAFDSHTTSFVYWEKPDIWNSVYQKQKLFFAVYPFLLDSLEDFDDSTLKFDGEFHSSDIFPVFEQSLQPMTDNTMGVKEITTEEGYPAYAGKGHFYNKIEMDGNGLRGKGDLTYLATRATSDTFHFFFDTATAFVKKFIQTPGMFKGAFFPAIEAANVDYRWFTQKDQLEISTGEREMELFQGKGTFRGKVIITPSGMTGAGTLKMGLVTVSSDSIKFMETTVDATRGIFTVTDFEDTTKTQMTATDVILSYNLVTDKCEFETGNSGKPEIIFHEQKYVTTLGKGVYDKTTNDVRLGAKSKEITKNYFLSTDVLIDSLTFYARESYFNFQKRELHVSGVPFINVADAKVVPDSTKDIVINRDGNLKTFRNAVIVANRDSNFHNIYDATVDILSAINYTATGSYEYIKVNGQPMVVNLDEIKVDLTDTATVAIGNIREIQKFFITDRILFDGTIELRGNIKFLRFTGNVRIQSKNPVFANKPFEFSDLVDPENIFIPVSEAKIGKLVLGLFFNPMYRNFNSRFLQEKQDIKDKEVLSAKGNSVGLTFDRERQEFRIGVRAKFNQEQFRGNQISLNDSINLISTEGLYQFPLQMISGLIDLKMSGKWSEQGKNNIETDITWGMEMKAVPRKAMSGLADKWATLLNISEDIDYQERALQESLAELLDYESEEEKNTKEFIKDLEKTGIMANLDLAKRIPQTLVVSDIKLKFNDKLKTLYYNGTVDVIGFGGQKINKKLNAYIEYEFGKGLAQGRENDQLRFYLEIDDMNWVFFNLSGEVVRTSSTESSYVSDIRSESDKAKGKGIRAEVAEDSEVTDFIKKFRTRYN